jgi:hypothetical protein
MSEVLIYETERGISEAQQAIELLARTLSNQVLVNETGREVLTA